MMELISLYKIGVLFIFSKYFFLRIFGSKEKILQNITPWRNNQVIDFYAMVLFSNIYGNLLIIWIFLNTQSKNFFD